MLILHVLQGPDRGKRFEFPDNEPQLIGRSSEALPLSDATVSRRHAELTPDDGRWFIRDLDSSNGTFVNGQAISTRLQLSPGDQIKCGSTLFVFAVAHDTARPSPIRLFDADVLETTVERSLDAADSMIFGSADPVRDAADHLRVIYELTAHTATTTDRAELLEKVMDLVFDEFKPDRGFILLMASASDRPDPAVVRYRTRPRSLDEGRIPVSRTIINHTLTRGQGVLSTNAMNDQRFSAGDSVREYGIRSALCVPIATHARIFGVISVDSSVASFTFTESQLRLLTAIGQHTALAMQSAEVLRERLQTERLAAMGETVASLSHSVKNILQGLRGGADAIELALSRGDLKLAAEGWPILSRNLDRIFALTMNMLAFSKPRTLDLELTSLGPLLEEVVELIQPQCDRKRVGLVLDVADDLPPIPIDAAALHQALMNVLMNALEASPEKKGLIAIAARFDPAAGSAVITVSDNGPGIEPDRHDQVFQAFVSTKGQRGTGLGLAVTQKIIAEHGGTIDLRSAPGKGTTIEIALPTDQPATDSSATHQPRPAADDWEALDG